MKKIIERFFKNVNKTDKCWIWTGSKSSRGYGTFTCGHRSDGTRKHWRAHRFSFNFLVKEIPPGLNILHKCDNPPCVNPDHLFPGTQKENVHDCIQKGRFPINKITKNKRRKKLTQVQVDEIRYRYKNGTKSSLKLGKEYGINHKSVLDIIKFKSWND